MYIVLTGSNEIDSSPEMDISMSAQYINTATVKYAVALVITLFTNCFIFLIPLFVTKYLTMDLLQKQVILKKSLTKIDFNT